MKSVKVRQLQLPTAVIVGCCCSALLCSYSWRKIQNWKKRQELLSKISKRQAERKRQFDRLSSSHPLHPDLVSITELSLEALLEKLQTRELRASTVLRAYIAKAVRATDEFNCVTEFIPWAEKLAEELDSLPSPKGPLHGLPIAIKDDHDVEGLDSTVGFAKNLYKPAKKNSVPVQILIDLGAVPFCKTNVPQALASINTDNPIYGTTYNALNAHNSPGGSSGGSGCIVAAGAAQVATGSDIAGSLRIPAHFHGLCSLRSTNGRLSREGMQGEMRQVITFDVVTGFITKDAKTQAKMFKLVTENRLQNQYDAKAVPLPWNETLFTSSKPLKIGYYTSLPIFPAFGDTPTTILRAKSALQGLHYELVEFPLPDSFDLNRSITSLFWWDLGHHFLKTFDGEPLSKSGTEIVGHSKTSVWMRKLLATFLSIKTLPTYSPRMKQLLEAGLQMQKPEEFTDCIYHLREVKNQLLQKMSDDGVDLLLGPVLPFPSLEEKVTNVFAMSVIYTFMWNVLDMPAGVVRFGTESGKLFGKAITEKDSYLEMAKKALPASIGLPINVQVIGKPFQEETVLRVLCDLEKCYGMHQNSNHGNVAATNGKNGKNGVTSITN